MYSIALVVAFSLTLGRMFPLWNWFKKGEDCTAIFVGSFLFNFYTLFIFLVVRTVFFLQFRHSIISSALAIIVVMAVNLSLYAFNSLYLIFDDNESNFTILTFSMATILMLLIRYYKDFEKLKRIKI